MTMYYYSRNMDNMDNINKLADNTKAAAKKLLAYAEKNKIGVLIYGTIRTEAQQRQNVNKGVSQTMKSYHLVGQALDFVPTGGYSKSDTKWNGYGTANIKKFIAYAKSIGFEWGGDWKGFVDQPHLQFNYKGYGTDTFGKKASSTPVKASKPSKSTNSGIKSVGKIKIVGVSNAAIIMDKPDRINAKNVGTIGLGKTIDIAGSVRGSNNSKGYWEIIHNGKRRYVSGQYGKMV
ncbi:M15 family metallopeptidase [Bacillus subtilis]|uniref:Bacteriophage P7-like protein n=2 Tax=Bacillus subtilis TaxID=1423 RepID=A0A0D1ISK8_BACIU|nr:bacteriophage P7-like protein [Bacillus subtilis]MED3604399.1 M15 family metallopeptidase [Bacillus subtilis]MED3694916.1 M15 family metallopeptidase [Bacillus subtilis]WEY83992.1 M15 family metallopeptidase [Bacillus subtilis]WEZ01777.1 M15 family metallopeptidase [Bacillus subtilis]